MGDKRKMNGLGTRSRALVRANQLQVEGWCSKIKCSTLSLISWVTNLHVPSNSVLLISFMDLDLAAAISVEGGQYSTLYCYTLHI